MKAILLDILEQTFQPADVTATQQMGVSMSSAVKRDGVVIIQNQNVEVYARIMPQMVRALRLCDSFVPAVVIGEIPKALPPPVIDPVGDCCEFLFAEGITWEEMQTLMKSRYLDFVIQKFSTKSEAAGFLGVGPAYLSKLTKVEAKK